MEKKVFHVTLCFDNDIFLVCLYSNIIGLEIKQLENQTSFSLKN